MRKTFKGRKFIAAIAIAALGAGAALGLAGCGGAASEDTSSAAPAPEETSAAVEPQAASQDLETITVAAVPTPHAEILNDVVAPILQEQGYNLVVQEFSDYVLPNTATEQDEVDANYFQHKPYLDEFNQEQGTHLVGVTAVHYEPFGLYAGKDKSLASLDDLADGASVAVPNDPTNEARALLLLEQAGLIKLADGAGITATKADIVENPKNLDIIELEAAQTAHSLEDVDIAAINSNYALEAGLNVANDAIVTEDAASEAAQTYANLLVVKEGNENNPGILALADALNSDAVRDYINNTYEGAVLPIF